MIRKPVLILLILLLTGALTLTACGAPKQGIVAGKVNVIVSFYPLYDFTQKIGGDHVNVMNLVPAGVEPHDWSPKSRDMKNLTQADLFVYLGAGFEGWVNDFLGSLKPDAKVKPVETSKGLNLIRAAEEDHEHGHKDDAHEGEWDPHAWLSPVNAQKMALVIKDALVKADPANQADYEKNYAAYAEQLAKLHEEYKQALAPLPKKEIVVSHSAFGYLCKEYGLTQRAIMGLSPDAEPTSKDIQQINAFIKEHGVKYIFFEELVSDKLAKTLAKDAGIETLVLNPLEGLNEDQLKSGEDYVSVMKTNLKYLIKALQ
ncbi:metal ABC transporter substrate-binding protein [Paenibacillus thalictri]|uniref:ABC transporter substrate-binding protein n=1 Tax=Paenibacillus thalictri TaxID=2527873 RepID=A0A4Q9DSP4_9BACL|nr:metal ABC transporter substrate-binding protein [Paenibacillus thalictri]TBL79917.1 ABC transporter substrate-binding protein [Paenibacillus thalictri]